MNNGDLCCICRMPAVGVATFEAGETDNWVRGLVCARHKAKVDKYGRVAGRVQLPRFCEEVTVHE